MGSSAYFAIQFGRKDYDKYKGIFKIPFENPSSSNEIRIAIWFRYLLLKTLNNLNQGIFLSFLLIGILTVVLNICVFLGVDWIIQVLQVPVEIQGMMKENTGQKRKAENIS